MQGLISNNSTILLKFNYHESKFDRTQLNPLLIGDQIH